MPRHDALPRAFDLARWSYCLDFVLVPPSVLALLWRASWFGLSGSAIAGAFAAGVLAWTLAEYWIHRSLFHGPLAWMHDEHHRRPRDFIGVASWGTFAAFALVWFAGAAAAGEALACTVTAGLMLGYLVYCSMHTAMHHAVAPVLGSRYGALMRRLHSGHHRGGRGNFGVTSPLWDVVFRTFRP